MTFLSTILATLSAGEKSDYYAHCADLVLNNYRLDEMTAHFVQHNAGIVFRLEDIQGKARFLLKIHESAGDALMDTPEQLAAQMAWLVHLATDGRVAVQAPIANHRGQFVTLVQLPGMDRLSPCTVQHWITAEHAKQWEPKHAHAVGVLLATLHSISAEGPQQDPAHFGAYHERYLREGLTQLQITVELGIINATQYELILQAGDRIVAYLARIERTPDRWGLIHGDLHQGNVFFQGDKAAPIDYGPYFSYFLYDLGVSLYHATFDEVSIRKALVSGYDSVRPLTQSDPETLETFMLAAALTNLAFQATLQEHRLSAINRRNMLQFVEKFCRPFVANEPFLFDGRSLTIDH
ncbi:MAG: phosphotransferase [Caldilineaceae bacterium]